MIKKFLQKNREPAQYRRHKPSGSGFVILFAVTLAALLLSIALGVANIALKEIKFGTSARDTNDAFFAADSGIECALFYDKGAASSFGGSGGSSIQCSGNSITISGSSPSWNFIVPGLGSSGKSCANVSIDKSSGTTIISKGYNIGDSSACSPTNPNRVERELKTTYGSLSLPPPPPPSGFAYHRQISINSGQVSGGGPLASFPVLVSFTDTTLKSSGNGGNVQSSSGTDILFTSDSTGATILPYEQEKYDPATGQIIYWVNIASLTNSSVFYMFYDKSGASDQSNKTAVWDSNYKGVWHMPNGTTLSVAESTGNITSTPTYTGVVAGSGQIGGSAYSDGTTGKKINYGAQSNLRVGGSLSNATWEFWMNSMGNQGQGLPLTLMKYGDSSSGEALYSMTFTPINYGSSPERLLRFQTQKGYATVFADSVSQLSLNVQNHVVVTYDGTNLRIYLNGTLNSTTAIASTLFSTNSTVTSFMMMGTEQSNAYSFIGTLDEARVSNTNRSADWIKTEYNNQSSPNTFYAIGSQE